MKAYLLGYEIRIGLEIIEINNFKWLSILINDLLEDVNGGDNRSHMRSGPPVKRLPEDFKPLR